MLLRAAPVCAAARLGAPRERARRRACSVACASAKKAGSDVQLTPACDLFSDNAKAAECWAGAAELTVPGTPAHERATAELRFRGLAEVWQLRAREAASAAEARKAEEEEDALQLVDDDAPFPWTGGFSAQLFWCLARFGLSQAGVKRRTRAGLGPKRDLWVNEDGTVDFVDADAVGAE